MTNPYYGTTGNPPNNTRGISVSVRNEFQLIQAGFDASYSAIAAKGAVAGQQWMGIQDFSTATSVRVPTPTAAAEAVNKAYADGLAFAAALPAQAGNAGKFVTTNGTTASWASVVVSFSTIRSTRSSNTALTNSDNTTLVAFTSGSFTQTFAPVATLGAGWYCWLYNQSAGDITLDPNGAELIDGLSSFIMYPGEVRFAQCDGTSLNTYVVRGFSKNFTSSGTFTKPPGYLTFEGEVWGGGASGAKSGSTDAASGAGGGACVPFSLPASSFGATETVTVASGGAAQTVAGNGNAGGTSSIGSLASSFGGGAGAYFAGGSFTVSGGSGGGALSAGQAGGTSGALGGSPSVQAGSSSALDNMGFGGGSSTSSSAKAGNSAYGGAAGAAGVVGAPGGDSLYGGAGGGGVSSGGVTAAPGVSKFGGNGGAAGDSTSGTAGAAPGGGGGATRTGAQSGAGARGEVRIRGVA